MSLNRWIFLGMMCMTITLVFSGCWNRRELPELAIITAMGIDLNEDSNEYLVTYQVVNPQGMSKTSGKEGTNSSTIVYRSTGTSIFEAIRKSSEMVPRQLFFSHAQFVVIGENLARRGISDIIDFFERSHEARLSSYFLIARGMKAEDIISATDPLEKIQAKAVTGEFKLTKKLWSHNVIWQVDDIIRALNDPGIDPTISGIRLVNKIAESSTEPKANLEISGVALFKDDKLIGWLDGDQARGFVRLSNTMKSTITMLDCNEKKNGVSIETTRSKSQIKVRIVNGKPAFYVHILEEGVVSEMNCKLPLNKADTINDLERLWRTQIEKEVTSTINTMHKKHVDGSGFGLVLSRHYPKIWDEWSGNWNTDISDRPVTVTVEATIQRTGMRRKSFM